MAKQKALYMETTSIDPVRTAGEIISALVSAGATQVNQRFENGKLIGLAWTMIIEGQEVPFEMPARVEPIYALLRRRRPSSPAAVIREQSERVAWRQLLRWVQAQLAMIETGMVAAHEVFMPYMQIRAGVTLFEQLTESRFRFRELPAAAGQ